MRDKSNMLGTQIIQQHRHQVQKPVDSMLECYIWRATKPELVDYDESYPVPAREGIVSASSEVPATVHSGDEEDRRTIFGGLPVVYI